MFFAIEYATGELLNRACLITAWPVINRYFERHALSIRGPAARDLRRSSRLFAIYLLRTDENPDNENLTFAVVHGEEQAIIADTPAKHALPCRPGEGLHIALEWVCSHDRQNTRNTLLNRTRKIFEVPLGCFGEITSPTHLLRQPTIVSFLL